MERRVLPQTRGIVRASLPWRKVALGATIAVGLLAAAPLSAQAAAPAACAALQEKYPDWKGKTLVNAINPHTPGYETIDPKDPSKYVGFDIDLGEAIGECLGFKLTYKPVTFAALLTTLAARTGRHRDLRHLRHQGTRQGGRLHHLFEGVRRRAGRQGQSEGHQRHQHLDVRRGCGREHRLCRGAADPGADARNARRPARPSRRIQLYDNNANCIQAILAGRADTYVNDVNTVDRR